MDKKKFEEKSIDLVKQASQLYDEVHKLTELDKTKKIANSSLPWDERRERLMDLGSWRLRAALHNLDTTLNKFLADLEIDKHVSNNPEWEVLSLAGLDKRHDWTPL